MLLSLSLFDKWENEGTGRLGNLPEVIYLSTKSWRRNSKEVFWVQSPWSGLLGRVSSCYPSAPHHHCPISVPLVWGYFDAVLGGTLSIFSELSLKGTVSFGSKSIRLWSLACTYSGIWRRKNTFILRRFSSATKCLIWIDFVSFSRMLSVLWSLLL